MSAPKLSPVQVKVLRACAEADARRANASDSRAVYPNFGSLSRWPSQTLWALLRLGLIERVRYSLTDAGRSALAEIDAIAAVRL